MSASAGIDPRDGAPGAGPVVAAMLARDAFSRWLGVEVLAAEPGRCTARLTVRADMVNGFGVCHGGVTFSLADSALAFASNAHGRVTMSIENAIGYPAPARVGDVLTADAAQESGGRRLRFYRVSVTNQLGEPVGHFRGTVYDTGRPHGIDASPDLATGAAGTTSETASS